MTTAEKVTPIETGSEITQFDYALTVFNVQEQVIKDLEEAVNLEITDSASEKVIRKHRQNAKAIEVLVEKKRLELNRGLKEKTDAAAGSISPRVRAVYDSLDEKIKAVESARAEAKAVKDRAKVERQAAIQAHFDMLTYLAGKPLEYNRKSEDIARDIVHLETFEVSAIDFLERQGEAELAKAAAIKTAETAFENRKKFEADQAELQAEAKRLEMQKSEFEKRKYVQDWFNRQHQEFAACISANGVVQYNSYLKSLKSAQIQGLGSRIQEAREYIDAVIISITEKRDALVSKQKRADKEADVLRTEKANLEKEKERIEAEKNRIAGVQVHFDSFANNVRDRKSDPEFLNQYVVHLVTTDFDEDYFQDRFSEFCTAKDRCIADCVDILHGHAIKEHEAFVINRQAEMDQARADATAKWEQTEAAKAAKAERIRLIGPDRLILAAIATGLDELVSGFDIVALNTDEANKLVDDLMFNIRHFIAEFAVAGTNLE